MLLLPQNLQDSVYVGHWEGTVPSAFLQPPDSLVGLWWSPLLLFETSELYLFFGLELAMDSEREPDGQIHVNGEYKTPVTKKQQVGEGRKEGRENGMN